MTDTQKAFGALAAQMKAALVERDDEVDMLLAALVAGEHALLVGPPGEAKTLALDLLTAALGGRRFSCLMTKHATPDDLFGPLDVPALMAGTSRRLTAGRLAEADYAVLDEVFRGSAGTLNAVLKLMNERVFDYGDGTERPAPLKMLVGAANRWPEPEDDLGAFFDRFLFRKAVRPVRPASLGRLIWAAGVGAAPAPLPAGAADAARAEAAGLPVAPAVEDVLVAVVGDLRTRGVAVGGRRARKAAAAARAAAWLAGAAEVRPEHLTVLQHVLWDDPKEGPAVAREVVFKAADPVRHALDEIDLQADAVQQEVDAAQPGDSKSLVAPTAKLKDLHERAKAIADPRAAAIAADLKRRLLAASNKSLNL